MSCHPGRSEGSVNVKWMCTDFRDAQNDTLTVKTIMTHPHFVYIWSVKFRIQWLVGCLVNSKKSNPSVIPGLDK